MLTYIHRTKENIYWLKLTLLKFQMSVLHMFVLHMELTTMEEKEIYDPSQIWSDLIRMSETQD